MKKARSLITAVIIGMLACGAGLAEELPMYREDEVNPYHQQVMQYLSGWSCFWGETILDLQRDELLPVYAYPSEDGWRGAKGKAAVHLTGPVTALAWSEDEAWLLIDYETSGKARRVRYIRRPEGVQADVPTVYALHVPMTLNRDAEVTDDPNGTRKIMKRLMCGDTVDVLGHVGGAWAYVELTVDGKPARGFLPLDALRLPEETPSPRMAAYMKGVWRFVGGGELLAYGAVFDGVDQVQFCSTDDLDGEIDCLIASPTSWHYAVYEGVWNDLGCPYVLKVWNEKSHAERYAMLMHDTDEEGSGREKISFLCGESGGYEQADDIVVIVEE